MGGEMAHDALAMINYGDNPGICVLGDSEDAAARLGRDVEQVGLHAGRPILIGRDRLDDCPPSVATLIGLDETPDRIAESGVLDWAVSEAERAREIFIFAPASAIDLLAAGAWHPGIDWIVDGSERERLDAVASAARPRPSRLHDIGRDEGSLILQQLTEDVSRIAAMLASLTDEEAAAIEAAKTGDGEAKDEPGVDAAYVRGVIRARRLRDQFFRGGLFADPAWDMLLDLMAARLEGARVAVSSLCIAAAVPATTALRWIKALTDRGLFVRSADPQDGRRVYIALSDDAARALIAYLRAVQRLASTAI